MALKKLAQKLEEHQNIEQVEENADGLEFEAIFKSHGLEKDGKDNSLYEELI